jgi:hypothetical protein
LINEEVFKKSIGAKGRRKMALRKFKKFIQDHEKPVSRQLQLNFLEEETDDSGIVDAATVIIGQRVVGERTEVVE